MVVLVILRNSSRERLSVRNFLLNGNVAIAETAAATAEPTGDARALPVPPPVIVTETDGGKPATSCSCKAVPLFRSDVYQEQLSQRITWLNMSSLELLMKNHPNFPYSMIVNTSKEFCELLPSLHEWVMDADPLWKKFGIKRIKVNVEITILISITFIYTFLYPYVHLPNHLFVGISINHLQNRMGRNVLSSRGGPWHDLFPLLRLPGQPPPRRSVHEWTTFTLTNVENV